MRKTRLAAMGAEDKRHPLSGNQNADSSASVLGKRDRPPPNWVDNVVDSPVSQDKRPRADALRVALVADMEGVRGHDPWRNPELKSQVVAAHSSVVEGVDAAVSVRFADECNRVSC